MKQSLSSDDPFGIRFLDFRGFSGFWHPSSTKRPKVKIFNGKPLYEMIRPRHHFGTRFWRGSESPTRRGWTRVTKLFQNRTNCGLHEATVIVGRPIWVPKWPPSTSTCEGSYCGANNGHVGRPVWGPISRLPRFWRVLASQKWGSPHATPKSEMF